MIFFHRIKDDSMLPKLSSGQTVIVHQIRNFRVGQVVVAIVEQTEVVKRIKKIENGSVYLSGDNERGNLHGPITDDRIHGVVFWPRGL